eukprot:362176-Chlamydomonas_euryale.AAC.1
MTSPLMPPLYEWLPLQAPRLECDDSASPCGRHGCYACTQSWALQVTTVQWYTKRRCTVANA